MLGSIIRHRIAWHRAGGARRAPLTRGAALLACLLLSLPAAAQDEADSGIVAEDASDPWRLEFSPWIWLMGIDGEIGASGAPVDVSQSFADVMETSDSVFALSGRLELGHGRLGFFADGFYADLGVDDVGPASTDVEFQQVLLDFGVMYRVVDHEPAGRAGANRNDLTLDLYVGGRYSSLDLDLRPEGAPSTHDGRDWLDPIVGAKLVLPVAERLHLMLCGDVGGFGVSSDITWGATAVVGLDFHIGDIGASAMAGYRAIGWDYTHGDGPGRFTWDVVQHGLLFGLTLSF